MALAMVFPAGAAPASGPAAAEVAVRSVFVMPTNPNEGHDPFFPNSTRPYATAMAGKPRVGDVSSLILKGVSGPPNNRLAIINNHTFGIGDEQDIVTSQGRIHVRCVEIKDDTVVIESAGERHELKYTTNP